MASFNSLPLELVAKVIDLATESYVVLVQERARRKILLSLALVSKVFTSPAQQVLWRYIDLQNSSHSVFVRVIREGIGRDKKVRKLIFGLKGEENMKELYLEWFFEVLSGISGIEELTLFSYYGDQVDVPDFFEIGSVKGIKRLVLYKVILDLNRESFPTTLRNLTFQDMNSAEFLLSQLSLNPSAAVDTIEFNFARPFHTLITQFKGSLSYFKIHGANLQNLSFQSFNYSMITILLAYTPSLLHLTLPTDSDGMESILKYIRPLPSSTRLNEYGEFYEDGTLDQVENGLAFKTGLDKLVKLCQDRGVRLSFRSEEDKHYLTEIRKQKLYSERQKKLDRR